MSSVDAGFLQLLELVSDRFARARRDLVVGKLVRMLDRMLDVVDDVVRHVLATPDRPAVRDFRSATRS